MEHLGVHIKFVQNNKITNTEEGTGVLQLIWNVFDVKRIQSIQYSAGFISTTEV